MRLYLSSFDIGKRPEELVALARGAKRVAIILNALDNRAEARAKWLHGQTGKLQRLGFAVTELDLRDFFGKADALADVLKAIDLVWISGGNAFILRRAMRQSGFDRLVAAALAHDEIVYAGFSAAAVIVSASLVGLDIVDDARDVPAGYDKEIVWEGLGLLPCMIAVHAGSDHPESSGVRKEIAFFEANGIAYRALRDGEVLLVDGLMERIVGY